MTSLAVSLRGAQRRGNLVAGGRIEEFSQLSPSPRKRGEGVDILSAAFLAAESITIARQSDREFGELAGAARDLDRAAVLLRDDVPAADREPETRPFAGRLGRKDG
jgi:hypothetical protein